MCREHKTFHFTCRAVLAVPTGTQCVKVILHPISMFNVTDKL